MNARPGTRGKPVPLEFPLVMDVRRDAHPLKPFAERFRSGGFVKAGHCHQSGFVEGFHKLSITDPFMRWLPRKPACRAFWNESDHRAWCMQGGAQGRNHPIAPIEWKIAS